MILVADIGNTSTAIGFCEGGGIADTVKIRTCPHRSADEYAYIINGHIRRHGIKRPEGAALCSVVPAATALFKQAVKNVFGIEAVITDHTVKTGLKFAIKDTETLGADRIANAVAAHRLYRGDLIVVDFGTATTFCAITEGGEYCGGAIMPGLALSAGALAENTAKLPAVELKAPGSILGGNTFDNMQTGIILGHAGAVERIIHEITAEKGGNFTVIFTGGLAGIVKPYIRSNGHVNPLLTLEGLRFIYEMNS